MLLSLGLALFVGPRVLAQEPQEAVWRFGDESVEVQTLVDLCSNALGRVIEYDPKAVSGEVWLSSAAVYPEEGLWALLNRELATRDTVIVQPPGSEALRIVPVSAATKLARFEEPDLRGARAGFLKVLVLEAANHYSG